jgi:hypothetical protein
VLEATQNQARIWKFKTVRSAARAKIRFCIYLLNGDYSNAEAEDRKIRERYADILDGAMFEPHPEIHITEEAIRIWAERLKVDHALRAQQLAMLKACIARENSEESTEAQALHELAQTLTADDLAAMQELAATGASSSSDASVVSRGAWPPG